MANPEHLKILKQGVKVWNEWRKIHPEIKPDYRFVPEMEYKLTSFKTGETKKLNLGEICSL